MRPSTALSIGAVFNILAGLPVALATAPMLSAFGLVVDVVLIVVFALALRRAGPARP
jgi:hypothetical protein